MDRTKPNSPAVPRQTLLGLPWLLCSMAAALAVYVWGNSFGWQFGGMSTYQLFPVLGLLVFSIMWSHYMVGVMRRLFLHGADLSKFFSWTGYVVLLAIVLHPGLLTYQRFRDGFGLPPGSEFSYVAPGLAWVVLLGMVSLFIFLAFELRRWFERKRWWPFVLYANDAAMVAIFYHGLRLGTQTHIGWYRTVWWFYGLSLLAALAFTYVRRARGLERMQNFDSFGDNPKSKS